MIEEYASRVPVPAEDGLGAIAVLMIDGLFLGCGAALDEPIEITSYLHPTGSHVSRCAPAS